MAKTRDVLRRGEQIGRRPRHRPEDSLERKVVRRPIEDEAVWGLDKGQVSESLRETRVQSDKISPARVLLLDRRQEQAIEGLAKAEGAAKNPVAVLRSDSPRLGQSRRGLRREKSCVEAPRHELKVARQAIPRRLRRVRVDRVHEVEAGSAADQLELLCVGLGHVLPPRGTSQQDFLLDRL
jgi:hypothetical protein